MATFANFTSYLQGLNGIDVDVAGLAQPTSISASSNDFAFAVSRDGNTWTAAPTPTGIVVRAGAGANGSDRIEVTFADGAITNEWLRVTMLATSRTGLATPLVFYVGNLVGDVNGNGQVTGSDVSLVKVDVGDTNVNLLSTTDINRNGVITGADVSLVKINVGNSLPMIITAPGPVPVQQVYEWYAYDGQDLVQTFSGSGSSGGSSATLEQRYLYGPGTDQVLAEETPGNPFW